MTLVEIQQKINQMRDDRNWMQFHNPKNMAISVMLEANEILEHFKNVDNLESGNLAQVNKGDILQEIADVATYLVEFVGNCGLDLNDVVTPNKYSHNDPKSLAISLVLETNELLECFQWRTFEESEIYVVENKTGLQEKIKNVFGLVLQFTDFYNVDLVDIMYQKIEKNIAKYPVEKSHGNARKYNEL